jgi:deoxycytidylate deaminase
MIKYPYLPQGRDIFYVSEYHPTMMLAKEFARGHSLDKTMPGAAVILAKDLLTVGTLRVLGIGANGSDYHKSNPCQRVILGSKTGEGYELCEGCHPQNHSEAKAITDVFSRGLDPKGADLYLWGHWWCCNSCWDKMIAVGIRQVFLRCMSDVLFNKDHPRNIVGRQFE